MIFSISNLRKTRTFLILYPIWKTVSSKLSGPYDSEHMKIAEKQRKLLLMITFYNVYPIRSTVPTEFNYII